jgi:hypothetical protein
MTFSVPVTHELTIQDLLTPILTVFDSRWIVLPCRLLSGAQQNRGFPGRSYYSPFFGGFQAGMTAEGRGAGTSVGGFVSAYDYWAAFVLLLIFSGKMVREGMQGEEEMAHRTDMLRLIPSQRSPLLPASIP